jgi:hypothetical protein
VTARSATRPCSASRVFTSSARWDEAGRLPNGDPDLYFRGFYCWNSEVGSKTLGIASFYLRAVCMNRNHSLCGSIIGAKAAAGSRLWWTLTKAGTAIAEGIEGDENTVTRWKQCLADAGRPT